MEENTTGRIKEKTIEKVVDHLKLKHPMAVSINSISESKGIDKYNIERILSDLVSSGSVEVIETTTTAGKLYRWKG